MNTNDDVKLMWDFPSTGRGEEDGLNDPLQKYFEGDHERFVAREAIQNTIDARDNNKQPVVISFERIDIETSQIPGISQIKDIFSKAADYSQGQEGSEEFYAKASEMLNAQTISVLKISDYNTFGLNGSDTDTGGSWYRLIRSAGASSIKGAGGGSFGIGKGAPFAASGLRTVFYSTLNNEKESVFQGKIRISSFKANDGDIHRGMGMYGIPQEKGVSSVRNINLIPEMFQRTERGTDIFILGYLTEDNDWRSQLIQSILNNFWAAIHYNELNVKLVDQDKSEELNSGNIRHYLNQNAENVSHALACYEAVVSPDKFIEGNLRTLGSVKLFVKLDPNYPKIVQMMRSSKMLIEERKFRVLPEPYAAVFICENDQGNKKLRTLEPPAHDQWRPDLNKSIGKQIVKEFTEWIKGELRKFDTLSTEEPEEIPDLSKFLPKVTERDDEKPFTEEFGKPTIEVTDDETYKEIGSEIEQTPIPVKPLKQVISIIKSSDLGNSSQKLGNNDSVTKNIGLQAGDHDGPYRKIDISKISFRNIIIGQGEYLLVINPLENDHGSLNVYLVGEDNSYPAEISEAFNKENGQKYSINGSQIKDIKLIAGEPQKIRITLKAKHRYVLGIE